MGQHGQHFRATYGLLEHFFHTSRFWRYPIVSLSIHNLTQGNDIRGLSRSNYQACKPNISGVYKKLPPRSPKKIRVAFYSRRLQDKKAAGYDMFDGLLLANVTMYAMYNSRKMGPSCQATYDINCQQRQEKSHLDKESRWGDIQWV